MELYVDISYGIDAATLASPTVEIDMGLVQREDMDMANKGKFPRLLGHHVFGSLSLHPLRVLF